MCKIIIWDIKIHVFPDEIKTEKYQHSQSDDFCEFCLDIWIEFRPNRTCRKLPVFSWPYMYFFRRRIWVGVVGCRTSTKVGLLDLKKEFKKNKSLKAFKTMSKLLPLHRGYIDLPRQTDMHTVISHTVQIISNLIAKLVTLEHSKKASVRMTSILFSLYLFLNSIECRLETLQNSKNHFVDFKSDKWVLLEFVYIRVIWTQTRLRTYVSTKLWCKLTCNSERGLNLY